MNIDYIDDIETYSKKILDVYKRMIYDKTKELNQQIKDNKKNLQNQIKKEQVKIDAECKVAKEAIKILNDAAVGVKK